MGQLSCWQALWIKEGGNSERKKENYHWCLTKHNSHAWARVLPAGNTCDMGSKLGGGSVRDSSVEVTNRLLVKHFFAKPKRLHFITVKLDD